MRNKKVTIKISTLVILFCVLLALLAIVIIAKSINKNTISENNTLNISNTLNTSIGEEKSSNNFSLYFLKKEITNKNMIYSPLSIKYALNMLKDGASEKTLNQINKVVSELKLPRYKSIENSISVANGIFIRDTYYGNIKQTYKDILKNQYDADIIHDKFQSAINVNNWIETKTLGIIKNMLADDLVKNPDLMMLLINALAIDLNWQSEFDTDETSGKTFYKSDGTKIQATTMSKETSSKSASYYIGNDTTAISMDLEEHEGTQMEFLAIMPEENLEKYIKELNLEEINNITNKLKLASSTSAGINIRIPKFSFDYDLNLKQDLIDLGITDAFSEISANFSNMTEIGKNKGNLYVGEALHKAKIDFTENGIKASAVTVFAMMDKIAMMDPLKPVEININKPFLFLIRDKKTKEIWFVGTVYEPNLWENDKFEYQKAY